MNINQLLAFSFLIYILLNRSTIESFGNQKDATIRVDGAGFNGRAPG